MSEEANAPSNGASEAVSVEPVAQEQVTTQQPEQASAPPSRREALEKAMASVGETDAAKPDRNRAPDGKFAKAQEIKQVELKPGLPGEPVKVVDANAPVVGQPPQRFTKAAQEAWALTPEPVKAEVERAITELTQGVEKYRSDAEAYAPFKPFTELAKQHNVEPTQALKNYVEIDRMLAAQPLEGLLHVCRSTNINPVAAAQAILEKFGQQMPQEGQPQEFTQLQQINAQLLQKVTELESKVGGLSQTWEQQQYQQAFSRNHEAVVAFAADKPYFAEVMPAIEQLIATGFAKDLPDAYEKAVRLTPEVFQKIEAEKAAKAAQPDPAQTREKANKSITGTPSSGSNPATRKASGSIRESLQGALAQVGGI